MEELKVAFKFERSTKNTHRYMEIDEFDVPVVGALYVRKDFLDEEPPENLVITISDETSNDEG